ncbi:MAG: hypothetical protein IJ682_12035 [Lachnospiraceae bacterium]|nr:hypothetical protein [Lachnospiraceae bacterium]
METIRNYLETMFSSLPNTAEVHKAKDELYGMMEDKYNALTGEGLSSEEAVAKVIAEFGSLGELAEDLGIQEAVGAADGIRRRQVTAEEADAYLADSRKVIRQRAWGIGLIVASTACTTVSRLIYRYFVGGGMRPSGMAEQIGVMGMFVLIAIGVGMIIMANARLQKWSFLSQEPCQLDFPTLSRIDEQYQKQYGRLSMQLAVGMGLCIVSVVPPFLFNDMPLRFLGDVSIAILMLLVAVGVGCIVSAAGVKRVYRKLLDLNGSDTVGGNQFASQKELHFNEPMVETAMSVYWQTVLCLYLSWSFLTFSWGRTWVIWPLAALVHWLMRQLFERKGGTIG